jgi:hypothetical protein
MRHQDLGHGWTLWWCSDEIYANYYEPIDEEDLSANPNMDVGEYVLVATTYLTSDGKILEDPPDSHWEGTPVEVIRALIQKGEELMPGLRRS